MVQYHPFRSPYHTVTKAGIIGGGSDLRPGELSRSNYVVLLFDELPKFCREVLECLRQPLRIDDHL
ncbi:ATP-binding protein [Desulfosporosinus shakirovi]|uniref:ATP-binding protein n=1 Tax=Desulfosporosinus shakirovi TaxID=2885154 RepID=UPI00249EDABB|nr:ATP-binding protein [Desulfosporosinus sp. SRJS8]